MQTLQESLLATGKWFEAQHSVALILLRWSPSHLGKVHFSTPPGGSTFLQVKRAGAWTLGAPGKLSKDKTYRPRDIIHLQPDPKISIICSATS